MTQTTEDLLCEEACRELTQKEERDFWEQEIEGTYQELIWNIKLAKRSTWEFPPSVEESFNRILDYYEDTKERLYRE